MTTPTIRIATDSSAGFTNPLPPIQRGISVIPMRVTLGTNQYEEGVSITSSEFYRYARANGLESSAISVEPPLSAQIATYYQRLRTGNDRPQILSIHLSDAISTMSYRAAEAGRIAASTCDVTVFASNMIGVGLGWLVEKAFALAALQYEIPQLLIQLRELDNRCFSLFYIQEAGNFLRFGGLMHPAEIAASRIAGFQPIVTLDEGDFHIANRVTNLEQGLQFLVTFIRGFEQIEEVCIVYSDLIEVPTVKKVVRRLHDHWRQHGVPDVQRPMITTSMYGPSLAHFIGSTAIGVFIRVAG